MTLSDIRRCCVSALLAAASFGGAVFAQDPPARPLLIRGEVVEVAGDTAKVAVNKGEPLPKVGDAVKIFYEVPGTDIKADVATGKVAKVESGIAGVDIANKTAEVRKGYLAEIASSTGGNVTEQPPKPATGIDLAGEWTMKASEKTAFGAEFTNPKPFRLERTPQGIFVNPGSSNAKIVVAKDEVQFFNNAGSKAATAILPKTGAVERIEWSDGSVFSRAPRSAVDPTAKPDTPPAPVVNAEKAGDLSGRWADEKNGLFITLKGRPDGSYHVEVHRNFPEFANAKSLGGNGEGGATLDRTTLRVEIKTESGNGHFGTWMLDDNRTRGKGNLDKDAESTLVKLAGAPPRDAKDLSGEWEDSGDAGRSIWTLKRSADGKSYDARQQGLANAAGTGVLAGDKFRIDWKADNGLEGVYEWALDADFANGKATNKVVKGFPATFNTTVARRAAGAAADTTVTFSRDGTFIVAARHDTVERLASEDGGPSLGTFKGLNFSRDERRRNVSALALHPEAEYIFGAADHIVGVWDSPKSGSAEPIWTSSEHKERVTCAAWSPSGSVMATGSADKTLRLWDLKGTAFHTLTGHKEAVRCVAFSGSGKYIASGGDDQTVRVWETDKGTSVLEVPLKGVVAAVAFSGDGRRLLVAVDNKVVGLDARTGEVVFQLEGHEKRVTCVAGSPDGKQIVAGGEDKTVRIWAPGELKVQSHSGHAAPVAGVLVTPDGRRVISVDADRKVRVWNIAAGRFDVPEKGPAPKAEAKVKDDPGYSKKAPDEPRKEDLKKEEPKKVSDPLDRDSPKKAEFRKEPDKIEPLKFEPKEFPKKEDK